jgi:hypothetical protein
LKRRWNGKKSTRPKREGETDVPACGESAETGDLLAHLVMPFDKLRAGGIEE